MKRQTSSDVNGSPSLLTTSSECLPYLSHPCELKKLLSCLQVRILVCLGLGREGAARSPQIDERLHGFQLLRLEHVESGGRQDEVAEAAVQLLLEIEMVERVGKMGPVQMSIYAEHLQEDGLANAKELLREPAAFADPLIRARQNRDGCDLRIVGERHSRGFGRKDLGVIDLAGNPPLHECDVLKGRELYGFKPVVKPRVGMVAGSVS